MKIKIKNGYKLSDFHKYKLKKGLKNSTKRLFVIAYFMNEDRHFSTEELYDEIKKIKKEISYSTVYRTLKLLADFGLASECNFEEGISRFEPVHKAEHHDHLICQKCGKIIEFKNSEIENLQQNVAHRYNFSVESHKLELYGICKTCKKKKQRKK